MGRAFEFRKARKLKRWGNMAKTFTRLGKQIAIAVAEGGPDPENNSRLRAIIATCKHENMPKDNIERAIKNAAGKDKNSWKTMRSHTSSTTSPSSPSRKRKAWIWTK